MIENFGDFYKGKRILVTGHTGFKGAWLSFWLNFLGASVVGYSLPPHTNPNMYSAVNLSDRIISLEGDIRDKNKLFDCIEKYEPEIIFHLAAQSLVSEGYLDPTTTFDTNVIGTANILESSRIGSSSVAIVVVTSDKCYKNTNRGRFFVETDELGGFDPYSSSKACAELVTSAYRNSYFEGSNPKCLISSVRAGNVIGGGDWSKNRLIPDCVRGLVDGTKIRLRSPNSNRPWQHVLDPLSGYLELAIGLYNGNNDFAEAWNFGPKGKGQAVEKIVSEFCAQWGENNAWSVDQSNQFEEAETLGLDSAKSRRKLNWKPKLNIDKSLKLTVDWYKTYYKDKDNIESLTINQIKNYSNY